MLRSRGSRRLLVAIVAALAVTPVVGGCSRTARPPEGEPPAARPTQSNRVQDEGPPTGDRHTTDPERGDRERALRVLRAWDARRAVAFADSDAGAVRSLYAPGSGLARQDVALLRDYARRGARVTALVPQVVSVSVRVSSGHAVELVVVERVGVAEVSVGGQQRALTGARFARHALRFVRAGGGWRLSSARVA